MSLRVRLWLVLALVVVVPLAAGALFVGIGVPRALDRHTADRVEFGRDGVAGQLTALCDRMTVTAEVVGREAAAGSAAGAVSDVVSRGLAGFAAVFPPGGRVVTAGGLPRLSGPPRASELPSCRTGVLGTAPAIVGTAPLRGRTGGTGLAVAAQALDANEVASLHTVTDADIVLSDRGNVVATTLGTSTSKSLARAAARAAKPTGGKHLAGRIASIAPAGPGHPVAVVVAIHGTNATTLAWTLVAVLLLGLLIAAVVGWQVASSSTRPLEDLSEAATRVAAGDLETRLREEDPPEVRQLAIAFNRMTDALRAHIRALESSRDEMRRNLMRLGDMLSGTHDLARILSVILDTSVATVRAEAGAIFLTAVGRGELYLKVGRGLDRRASDDARVRLGEGVVGLVASTGEPVLGIAGDRPDELRLVPAEPRARNLLVVPLRSGGRVIGVLGLYDRIDGSPFDDGDLATIRTFASQATVAIDNVILHQEAQRLAITDGLTGLWNYRYFSMNLGKEIERAARFGRPLALMMMDLDNFKTINDQHGHQRGDAVLVEFASRIKSVIREVDIFARYGGEEFVLALPETDAIGASQAAERLCDVIRSRSFGEPGEEQLRVTVSIGVAVFPAHADNAAALLRLADEAMYGVKRSGRDGWRLASGPMPPGESDQAA